MTGYPFILYYIITLLLLLLLLYCYVSLFLNSDKGVSTFGLINFQCDIIELVTGFMMSKCQFES